MHHIIDFEKELNPEQYSAVMSPPDVPTLVLAGAGSGKTRTLTYRVAHFVQNLKIRPQELLLLTFTNKASTQMLERVNQLCGIDTWQFWGGTFHSIGSKFLRLEGGAIGLNSDYTIADAEDAEKLLKHCVESCAPKFFSNKDNPKSKLLKEIISYSRNTLGTIESAMQDRFAWLETSPSEIEKIAKNYEERKRKDSICDFDDLLELWCKLLEENPAICAKYSERFKNVLVDEYQDTNRLQCKVLDLLCKSGKISAVGDDAQCIYSWRGADIGNILEFKNRYPNGVIYKVEQNYRSTPQILNFANEILEGFEFSEDFKKKLCSTREEAQKPVVIRTLDNQTQSRIVADMIEELTGGFMPKYKRSDIAILYRAHFQAMDMQLQMQYRNIPFAITSGLKFFEQAHVKDIVAQMRFAANSKDFISFSRFLKFLPKIGEKTAFKIFEKAQEISDKTKQSLISALSFKEVLAKVPEVSRQTFVEVAQTLLDLELSIKASRGKEEDVLEDLFAPKLNVSAQPPKELVRLACEGWYTNAMKSTYEDWQDRVKDFDSLYEYASRFKDMDQFLSSISLEYAENAGQENQVFGERVSMMTVHQAKGLEFPLVFVIGAAEGLFPLKRCIEEGDIDEERRLFYVACTRAKDFLVITYPRIVFGNGHSEMLEPSEFWYDIDSKLYERNY